MPAKTGSSCHTCTSNRLFTVQRTAYGVQYVTKYILLVSSLNFELASPSQCETDTVLLGRRLSYSVLRTRTYSDLRTRRLPSASIRERGKTVHITTQQTAVLLLWRSNRHTLGPRFIIYLTYPLCSITSPVLRLSESSRALFARGLRAQAQVS